MKKAFLVVSMIAVLGAAAVFGVSSYLAARRSLAPAPAPAAPPAPPPPPAAPPAPPLPPLDESDAAVRRKAGALSTDPAFTAWLEQESLLRRLVAAVELLSRGQIPRDALGFLAPGGKFEVLRRGGVVTADPRAYARWDLKAAAFASVDAQAAAKLAAELAPLLDAACRELSAQDCDLKRNLAATAKQLADTPVPARPPRLVRSKKGMTWAYADPKLEALPPASKLLLRMGPANAAKVQGKLAELAAAFAKP